MQNELNQLETQVKKKKQNNNKKNGLRFENKLKEFLENLGTIVIRSAASKSLIDLVVLANNKIGLIQCKSTKGSKLPNSITSKNKEFSDFAALDIFGTKIISFYSYKTKIVKSFRYNPDNKKWEFMSEHYLP